MDARGTRIVELQKEAAARPEVIGLSGGLPADELMPKDPLGRALAFVATRRDEALQYGWPEGAVQLRRWIASRLRTRGAVVDPERIIITAGAQQALSLAGTALLAAGIHDIAMGEATYPGAIDAFRRAGLSLRAREGGARYVTAGVEMPSGKSATCRDVLSGGARHVTAGQVPSKGDDAIRDSLDRSAPIVVDEAYAELRFDGTIPRPLIADAPDRVWHVGTISKTIAPGLRVGWLIPPEVHHDDTLDLKSAADLHTASICQAAVARLVTTLDYDSLCSRARAAYAERARLVAGVLRASGLDFPEPAGGFSIWIETNQVRDEIAFLEDALAAGVMVDPGSLFRPEPNGHLAMRVSYSNAPIDQLAEGGKRLVRVLDR